MPFVETNEIHLHYEVYGEGEPLVLISPFAAPAMIWFFQIRAFKKHYRVVAFDNRGVWRSSKPSGPYTAKMMAADTLGLMDHIDIVQANILENAFVHNYNAAVGRSLRYMMSSN